MSSLSIVQIDILPHFLVKWGSITSNRFELNMVKGHHLLLRKQPSLFCDFKWFSIKAAAAHCPVILADMKELLVKGAIEPSCGGTGFYSDVFVVSKCMGGL